MHAEVSTLALANSRKVIGLVSVGHFFSHFYMLLLPPLFPILREVYGVGFTELGLAMTAFSLTTGLTQAPVGFLVDRYGARSILVFGLVLESAAIALIGVVPLYGALIALMVMAGLANAVYHPADYAILNASVAPDRMGRAFSLHTFAGYLGDAVAPVTIIFLVSFMDWRAALALCGLAGGAVAIVLASNSAVLRDAHAAPAASSGGRASRRGMSLLFSLPVVMGLLFFFGISMSGRGISAFGVSTLHVLHGAPLATAGIVLSAYLFASPAGVLFGGWVADRIEYHERYAAGCMIVAAACAAAIASLPLSLGGIAALFAVMGFFWGSVAPSRDMLIRSITPPGEMGKVFGFVSTGFSIGGVIAPVLFGVILDHYHPSLVFWVIATLSLATMVTVLVTGRQGRRARVPLA